jgi:hypothetical protein
MAGFSSDYPRLAVLVAVPSTTAFRWSHPGGALQVCPDSGSACALRSDRPEQPGTSFAARCRAVPLSSPTHGRFRPRSRRRRIPAYSPLAAEPTRPSQAARPATKSGSTPPRRRRTRRVARGRRGSVRFQRLMRARAVKLRLVAQQPSPARFGWAGSHRVHGSRSRRNLLGDGRIIGGLDGCPPGARCHPRSPCPP